MKNRFIGRVLILFLLLAVMGIGASPASADGPYTPPNAPNGLTATNITSSTVTLAWTDKSGQELGFRIERSLDGINNFVEVGTTGTDITTYKDSGLAFATTYYYRVFAFGIFGDSYPNTLTVTTKPLIFIIVPAAPTGLTASVISNSEIKINWVDKSSNENSFNIERKGGPGLGGAIYSKVGTVGEGITTYTDSGLNPGTAYTYRVSAHGISGGTSNYSNEATATTNLLIIIPQPPLAPVNLAATGVSTSRIDLTWEDKSTNESGFKIGMRMAGVTNLPFTEIGSVGPDVTSYSNSGLYSNTNYEYRVMAYNGWGESAYTNFASAKTAIAPVSSTTIRLYIDMMEFYVNNVPNTMDVAPILKDGRTLLPIRYVVQNLGGDVQYDKVHRMVTATLGGKTVLLWVGSNMAKVDGVDVPIDAKDSRVMPIIVDPGRTMVPMRFVAEALGCDVLWEPSAPKDVTVVYPATVK